MHNPAFHDIKAKLVKNKTPPENQKGLILYHSPEVWTHKTSLTPPFHHCRFEFVIGTKKTRNFVKNHPINIPTKIGFN